METVDKTARWYGAGDIGPVLHSTTPRSSAPPIHETRPKFLTALAFGGDTKKEIETLEHHTSGIPLLVPGVE